ncbi:MAG TPA: hypothetical protein V6D17_24500 [Candidatus Obscuribacterales bacterium]
MIETRQTQKAEELEDTFQKEASENEESNDELARPALTIKEASYLLGKSVRALERSIVGRWGNKLPEGWVARKVTIDGREEWRIIPPASFKVRHRSEQQESALEESDYAISESELAEERTRLRLPSRSSGSFVLKRTLDDASPGETIIIDRSEEVEHLLKELVKVHRALAEETRQHVEDLRMLNEMTNSVRLLETNDNERARLKEELAFAQKELLAFKQQYQEYLSLPWWKRLFRKFP